MGRTCGERNAAAWGGRTYAPAPPPELSTWNVLLAVAGAEATFSGLAGTGDDDDMLLPVPGDKQILGRRITTK
jgi:hypothetical protein